MAEDKEHVGCIHSLIHQIIADGQEVTIMTKTGNRITGVLTAISNLGDYLTLRDDGSLGHYHMLIGEIETIIQWSKEKDEAFTEGHERDLP